MSQLLDRLASWQGFVALVVGDYMLDELVFGDVDRLCNDAPVPVLAVERTESRAGGAANVCVDLVALRGRVEAFGVVGADSGGAALRRTLGEAGVGASGLIDDESRPTTVKRSLIGLAQHRHAQKLFRLDYESRAELSPEVARRLIEAFGAGLRRAVREAPGRVVVCIEDYAKGVCSREVCRGVIELCAATISGGRAVPVLVDPAAGADFAKYAGCATITPNRNEAERFWAGAGMAPSATGRNAPEDFGEVAALLVERLGLDAAVITLDKHGALLMEAEGPQARQGRVVPTVARRVYDVTGAGDMVLAALAGARANGLDWYESVRFANAAAGLEVEEFGVVPIPLERIHRDLLQRERSTRGKLRSVDELLVELAALRQQTRQGHAPRVVFANGCFDVLHAGHVSLLRRASELGDFLVVATNDDAGIRRLKGPDRPVYPMEDRVQLLGALEFVDAVVVFSDDTPEALVRAVRPDVLVKGAQYDKATIPGAAFVESIGGRVALLDVVEGRSTTSTVAKIRGPKDVITPRA